MSDIDREIAGLNLGGFAAPMRRVLCHIPQRSNRSAPAKETEMTTNDLTSAIDQSHAALGAILKGDPSVYQALYSQADDVTLGNPFGPYVRGRQSVEATLAGAASHYRDGEATDVELIAKYVSDNLACVVEVERGRSKVGGAEEVVPVAVRVTSVFRLERGSWRLVHRHADPITTPRPAASVISR
jgi:ketosteroid isomerase-like protein